MKARTAADLNAVVASRSHMMEVCSESSFQPLLQLYLVLPALIMGLNHTSDVWNVNQSAQDLFDSVEELQLWSILSSVISLSWSFSHHQAIQMKGALEFETNFFGRIFLLLSNIHQISSRLITFVLFAYTCGDGNFWPLCIGVLLHIVLMSVIYHQFQQKSIQKETKLGILYQSLVNGVANLYLWNLIFPISKDGTPEERRNERCFTYQAVVDSISLLENVIIISLAYLYIDAIPVEVFMYCIGGHLFGLFLKFIYYKFFHIWSPVLKMPCCA